MSSSRTCVQSHIKRVAPDADYQGCCLHGLNLVICSSSQIMSVKNMIDHSIKPICSSETLPRDNTFLSMYSNACVLSQREVKSLVSARQDGWSDTTHIAVFSSCILTWSEHGMIYAIQVTMNHFTMKSTIGIGTLSPALWQMVW